MKRRTESELMAIVWHQLNRASDFSTTVLQNVRRKAWDYYLNRPRGDERDGHSQVQDTTIRDTHHALMATIMPSYATDHVAQFEPIGPQDEQLAEAESEAVNNIFTEDNAGYSELSNAISDCLLFRNGVIKVWVETMTERATQKFDAQTNPGEVGVFLEQQGWQVESIDGNDDELVAVVSRETERLRVKSVEPAYFFVDPNMDHNDLQDAAFIGERVILTRQDLLDMGVSRSKVKLLNEIRDESTGLGANMTNVDVVSKFVEESPTQMVAPAWAEERVDCYWVHMLLDGEKWRFLVSDMTLLLKDPVNYFPYASGSGWPVPHRWSGLGLYDLLKTTQDSKTSIMRQYLDNLNFCNNPETVSNPAETSKEDLLQRAPGRNIRSTNPGNVTWLQAPDLGSNTLAALAYFDDVAGRQAGAALDMATAEAQSVKDVSGLSVEMQLGPKEQMASQISRNISETLVRQTFLLIHRALREDFSGTITYRRADQWVQVAPRTFQPRNRINIRVGLSPGDRRRHRSALEQVINYQLGFIQAGTANITANWRGLHAALVDWMAAAELDGAEGYFLNPEGQESQAGQQAAAQAGQQQSAMQQQIMALEAQLEQAKLAEDARQHDGDLRFKYDELAAEVEVEEAKLVESGTQARLNLSSPVAGTRAVDRGNGSD